MEIFIENIKKEYNILNRINFRKIPKTTKYFLLYGKIQSGKTGNIIAISHMLQIHNQTTVLIIPNNTEGYIQFRDRVKEYNERLNDEIEGVNIAFVGHNTIKNNKKIHSILSNEINGVIIALGNHTELKILCEQLSEIKDNKINLIIDEADTAYKENTTTFRPLFDTLLLYSIRVFGVSATTFKLWFVEDKIITPNVLIIEPSKYYKGIKDFSYHYIPKENRAPTRKEYAMENDLYFFDYLYDVKNRPLHQLTSGELHPHIILYRSSEILNVHHYQTQDLILLNYPDVTTITFNGDGIRIYSPIFEDKEELIINNDILQRESYYYYNNNIALKHVLEYLRINGGADVFRCIVIISGKLANRMISFVSSSYYWHLTNMYLLTGKRTSCDDLLQFSRLCGVYKYDNIKLEMAAHESVCRDLILADKMQNKLMIDAVGYNKKLNEYIKSKELLKSDIPKSKLVKGIKYKLNVTINPQMTDKHKLRVIEETKITGMIERQIYDAFIEVLERNKWYMKSDVINMIVERYDFAKNNDQVNGNLNSIIKTKTTEINEEKNGILLLKQSNNWLIKYFYI